MWKLFLIQLAVANAQYQPPAPTAPQRFNEIHVIPAPVPTNHQTASQPSYVSQSYGVIVPQVGQQAGPQPSRQFFNNYPLVQHQLPEQQQPQYQTYSGEQYQTINTVGQPYQMYSQQQHIQRPGFFTDNSYGLQHQAPAQVQPAPTTRQPLIQTTSTTTTRTTPAPVPVPIPRVSPLFGSSFSSTPATRLVYGSPSNAPAANTFYGAPLPNPKPNSFTSSSLDTWEALEASLDEVR